MVRFRLGTVFVVMAVVCATCALAPELRNYLMAFFFTFFSLVILGRAMLR